MKICKLQTIFYNIGPYSHICTMTILHGTIKHYGSVMYRFHSKLVCLSECMWLAIWNTLAYCEICPFAIHYGHLVSYSQHFIFYVTQRWDPKARVLHYTWPKKLDRHEHFSSLGPFVSHEENEVLWIWLQEPTLCSTWVDVCHTLKHKALV